MKKVAILIIALGVIGAVFIVLSKKTMIAPAHPSNTCANGYCQGADVSKHS